MKKILVFIPTLNAEKFLSKQLEMLKKQTIKPDIYVVDSGSKDDTIEILTKYNINFEVINKNSFNHGLTRNKVLSFQNYDYYLFLTQDAIPCDKYLIEHMVSAFDKKIKIVYARQIPYDDSNDIEKLARNFNYPDSSIVKCKKDIEKLGIKTFFTSNSCCMYEAEYFKKQRGFSNTNVSEDMEFAYRTVMDGYCIKYEAGTKVCHSHNYTLRSLCKRYFQIGCFFGKNRYFKNFKTTKEGKKQTKFILYNLIKRNPLLMSRFIAEVAVKFIGFKIGKIKCKN